MEGQNLGKRIEWCDVYKGIVIALVVAGHATNRYYQYIYQFHMAAFFFISGYTCRIREKSLLEEALGKAYKWLLPYFTINLAGISLFWVLDKWGVLGYVSGVQYPAGFQEALLGLADGTAVYCDWLGAMWFLPVLFCANLIFKAIAFLFRRDTGLFCVSMALFLYGEWGLGVIAREYSLDLAIIAQVFMMLGYFARKYGQNSGKPWQILVQVLLALFFWFGSIRMGFRYVVDWPSRSFNGPVDLVVPFLGIFLTVSLSRLIVQGKFLKKLFLFLGKNSMGIMCFHFIGFKAAYLILILLGRMDAGEASLLIPSQEREEWLLVFLMGITVGVTAWSLLNRMSVARILLGGESADKVYSRFLASSTGSALKEVCEFLAGLIKSLAGWYREFLKGCRHWKVAAAFCALCITGCVAVKLSGYFGEIEVLFPYRKAEVILDGGWLLQSDMENYRWFAGQAGVKTPLMDQDTFSMQGFIPDTVKDVTCFWVRVNGKEIYREQISSGYLIELELDVSEYVKPYRLNYFEIETDGIQVPDASELDQRSFSALVNWIRIY